MIATNTLDVRYPGMYQAGSRRGSVGQPLPGVSVRIVDPETFESCGSEEPGMLLVRGPNVMRGYLKRPDLTEKVMRDDWYITGDIAVKDADGFIRITDRLSRFSKIGGEMVPHGKVEDALHEAAAVTHQVFAVTAVPDEKKGERLAVLHTWNEKQIPELVEKLNSIGLPNLFIPRANQFVKVKELPFLGTGNSTSAGSKKLHRRGWESENDIYIPIATFVRVGTAKTALINGFHPTHCLSFSRPSRADASGP